MNREAMKKRIYLAKLNKKLTAVVARRGGSLCRPEVVAISRRMDKLVVEIMRLEEVVA